MYSMHKWRLVGEILVGFSSDEPQEGFSTAARNTLWTVTGVDIRPLVFRGKFAFIGQVGSPQTAGSTDMMGRPYEIKSTSKTRRPYNVGSPQTAGSTDMMGRPYEIRSPSKTRRSYKVGSPQQEVLT